MTNIWELPLGNGPRPSLLQDSLSMMMAGSAHLAPFGRGGSSTFRIGFSSAMNMVKARLLASGDQARLWGELSTWVNWATSRLSSHITWTWEVPSRSEMKATFRPSGDQAGDESRQLPEVSSRTRFPSKSVIHKLEFERSFGLSTQVRVKMMFFPSGEMAGLPTDSISMKVSTPRSSSVFLSWPPKDRVRKASRPMAKPVIIRFSTSRSFLF